MGNIVYIERENDMTMRPIKMFSSVYMGVTESTIHDAEPCWCCGFPMMTFPLPVPRTFCMHITFVKGLRFGMIRYLLRRSLISITRYPNNACPNMGEKCTVAMKRDGRCGANHASVSKYRYKATYVGKFNENFIATMRVYLMVLFLPYFKVTTLKGHRPWLRKKVVMELIARAERTPSARAVCSLPVIMTVFRFMTRS